MSLYLQWKELIENQTEESFDAFWETYSKTETKIYSEILEAKKTTISGSFQELSTIYGADPIIFMGFLDGINTSLKNELPIEGYVETSAIHLEIDFERLYLNMFKANADYLYSLEEWERVLAEDRRKEIYKDFKRSKTVVKEQEPGRNDPCPCGSGKKYKKCCGAN
jgi:hypothetical protein